MVKLPAVGRNLLHSFNTLNSFKMFGLIPHKPNSILFLGMVSKVKEYILLSLCIYLKCIKNLQLKIFVKKLELGLLACVGMGSVM